MFTEKYYYLYIDFFSVIFPLVFSFFPMSNPVYKKWKNILPAIIIPGVLFLLWDQLFTSWGIWNFNPRYLIGQYFFYLPIEEVAWFFCIPYACLFSYLAVIHFFKNNWTETLVKYISVILVITLISIASFNIDRIYTCTTFFLLAICISWVQWIWNAKFLGKFYLSYAFLLIPFFIVNGLLTGTGLDEAIVRYEDTQNLGIRIGTIPIEDMFYGMLLILCNVSIFEYLEKREKQKTVL